MTSKRSSSDEYRVFRAAETGSGKFLSPFAFPFAFGEGGTDRLTRGFSAFTDEVGRFVQARLRSDLETWSKLTSCRTPLEAMECQQRFAETIVSDYFDEFGKLSRMAMTMTNDAVTAFQAPAKTIAEKKVGEPA